MLISFIVFPQNQMWFLQKCHQAFPEKEHPQDSGRSESTLASKDGPRWNLLTHGLENRK